MSSSANDDQFPTIHGVLVQAQKQLFEITDCPQLEAELLLAHALKKTRSYLLAHPECRLDPVQLKQWHHYLSRRCEKEPLAYIIGSKEFWSFVLQVTPDTLIPRPESELLIEIAIKLFPDRQCAAKAADLGTGSGALAIALASERPHFVLVATDKSEAALRIAESNAQALGIQNVHFYQGEWCAALPDTNFDLILSNPPYLAETEWHAYAADLAFEPQNALLSGENGLDALAHLCRVAQRYLRPGGYFLLEHGYQQGQAVRELMRTEHYIDICTERDLNGLERVTYARVPRSG